MKTNQYFKSLLLILAIFWLNFIAFSQNLVGFKSNYVFIKSGSIVQDKNFYLLTLFEKNPEINKILTNDSLLQAIATQKQGAILAENCPDSVKCYVKNLYFSAKDSTTIINLLRNLYRKNPKFQNLVQQHLRPSGYFELYASLSNEDLFIHAWTDAQQAINNILRAYTESKGLRYAKIDSVAYPLSSKYYQTLVKEMVLQIREKTKKTTLFFQPSLTTALQLLFINNHDEAERHEPLGNFENKLAYAQIKKTVWDRYSYSVILLLGEGPENTMAISPNTKYRCQMGAKLYHDGKAPFLIVSGGYVHPALTIYCEALEMKRYLVENCHVPANVIIIEPQARHTGTNFRNATRIMFREDIPTNKKVICTTSKFQMDNVCSKAFEERNMKFLKYLPLKNLVRLNDFEIEFFLNKESLHMDSLDPLDP